ncbi:arginine:ornithine antiporter [Paenibacillus sp. J31TS4]|uniref:amino acid permease n=1 Tax=Paenibacillus sp. J31TS4 TaxID=2807195 RepID=UPI001B05F132|nr:amino acid permease [Paenibacillus sp. J31TS4]GIP37212.1 arginine:ornithine antiporter [Paenibacillus sp. J31TS4]
MKQPTLGLGILTALVVGNMVGSGIFMLPRTLAEAAGPAGVLLAWLLTGAGVLLVAYVFGSLAVRKPELSGGPHLYAKALFEERPGAATLAGYAVAWGYWVANWAGNVAIITTFASYLATFFPVLRSSQIVWQYGSVALTAGGLLTFAVCTVLLWGVNALILRGIEGAGRLNFAATAAKVAGFVLFIVIGLLAFEKSNLLPMMQPRLDEAGREIGLFGQVNHASIATLWAFIGVETAVVFSSRARRQTDIKRATLLGLLLALALYLGITILVMGTLSQSALMAADNPLIEAMTGVLGAPGRYLLAGLGLLSLLGSSIGWVLLSAEVPYQAAKQGLFPPLFRQENRKGAPRTALFFTGLMMQLLLLSTVSRSIGQAYDFVTALATLSFLVPYVFASLYHVKLVVKGDTYAGSRGKRLADGLIAVLAAAYSLWVIKAGTADWKTFIFGLALLGSGLLFYPFVKRTDGRPEEIGRASREG